MWVKFDSPWKRFSGKLVSWFWYIQSHWMLDSPLNMPVIEPSCATDGVGKEVI